jgi:hypothetical protein
MNQIQTKNPKGFQQISQAMRSNGNPQDLLRQYMSNSSPEQIQHVLQQAKRYGVPDNILSQMQNLNNR